MRFSLFRTRRAVSRALEEDSSASFRIAAEMESGPGELSPEASPALLERAVFRAGSHDDSQRDSPRRRSSVQGHNAQQRQMHMQAEARQVSCRTPVGTATDSDLLSLDDESPPLRLDLLFSHAVKPLPEVAGMGELPQVANTCEHGVDAGGAAPVCSMFTPAATGRQRIADPSSAGNDSPPLDLSQFTATGHKFCEPGSRWVLCSCVYLSPVHSADRCRVDRI